MDQSSTSKSVFCQRLPALEELAPPGYKQMSMTLRPAEKELTMLRSCQTLSFRNFLQPRLAKISHGSR